MRMSSQVLEELNVKELRVVDMLPVSEFPEWPVIEEGNLGVMIDCDITPELADEGLARELVHRLQTMRKQAGFDIADYIEIYYQGGDSVVRVMQKFASYIQQETLSKVLTGGNSPEGAYVKKHVLDGNEVTLAVKRI